MQEKFARFFSVLLASVCLVTGSSAADVVSSDTRPLMAAQEMAAFPIPDHFGLVNDYLGVLPIVKTFEITKKLQALERHNGTQIVFLSVPSVGPEGVHAYATRAGSKWDLGNNGEGNGVLFLVSANDGVAISTGAGIQGALPDVLVGRIVRETIEPFWHREQYAEGIEAGVDAMIEAAAKEKTKSTFYDYANLMIPDHTETRIIAILFLLGIAYISILLWERYQKRKKTML